MSILASAKTLAAAEARITELTGLLATSDAAKLVADGKVANYEGTGEGSVIGLRGALEAALADNLTLKGSLTQATGDLSAAVTMRDAYKAAINQDGLFAFANPEGGKPTLDLTAAGKARFVNADAARTLAASGHQPLPLAVDTPAAAAGASTTPTGEGRTKTTWARQF